MNKERLLKLEALLIADANNPQGLKFDIKSWAYKPSNGADRFQNYPQGAVLKVDCNTAGCGLGLAAISGIFKDEGLTYKISGDGELVVKFGDFEYFDAAREFFEIPERAARVLFDIPTYGSTTGAVAELELARRVRQLVETGKIIDADDRSTLFRGPPEPEGDPESPEDQGPDDWPEQNAGPNAAGTDD